MKIFKGMIFSILFLLLFTNAKVSYANDVIDGTITTVSKGTYYVTKFALQGSWYVIRKTAKGVKYLTLGVYNGIKDAFPQKKPVNSTPIKPFSNTNNNTLPSINNNALPPVPNNKLPVITY